MSFRQANKFFVIVISTLMLVATVVFNFGTTRAWAATLPGPLASQPQLASMNRAEAITKNLEGKAQEALGNVTGDPKDQMMGKAKQAESQMRNAAEDMKNETQLSDRAKAVAKNVEGKIQETAGNVTGSSKDQMMGRLKQTDGSNQNMIENVKDSIGDFFN
ncbi:CsbD family protein [Sodalinema gerasimenkoae]|uniref:CsbD family protein n=1 Tax=Sodalinema gerasimenkoae TaxID=2862348 RepID=UPI00135C7DBC